LAKESRTKKVTVAQLARLNLQRMPLVKISFQAAEHGKTGYPVYPLDIRKVNGKSGMQVLVID